MDSSVELLSTDTTEDRLKKVEPTERLEAVLATRDLDRQGDILEPAGLDFANYLKNPVVLWAHDLSRPPIGRLANLRQDFLQARAEIIFARHTFARELFSLYESGFLNAWSIGFIPRRWEKLTDQENIGAGNQSVGFSEKTVSRKTLHSHGYRNNRTKQQQFIPPGRGMHILEAEVVEVSAVPVPANPQAITITGKKNIAAASKRQELPGSSGNNANAGQIRLPLEQLGRLIMSLSGSAVI